MKVNCNIIQDLLPLYIEQLVSEKSKIEIEEHLKECSQCTKIYEEMRGFWHDGGYVAMPS